MFNKFHYENCATYETWKNILQANRPQMTAKYGAWKTEAININSEPVMSLIFLRKQQLGESTSMSSNTYIASLSYFYRK